ncbi:MAG: DNA helicase RecQ [Pseudomonadota bacterium]
MMAQRAGGEDLMGSDLFGTPDGARAPGSAAASPAGSARDGSVDAAQDVLEQVFGYKHFRFHQRAIVDTLIAGGDALALMPTGGGKSLCYQVPALVRKGTAIVVSPLIALMQDQVDALEQHGVKAAYINSSLTPDERAANEWALRAGELDLLYIAPERLVQERTLSLLERTKLALFAIDEAHCVSQWGHDFRPEYRQLSILAERFPKVPRIALTATADERTRAEIVQQLGLEGAQQFVASFDRPNIRYLISDAGGGAVGRRRMWDFIATNHAQDAGIVYCLSRRAVEETAQWLSDQGRVALAYHAGMPAEQRRIVQARFLAEESIIVVATIAFGMGIDKPDVRFVAHLNLPKSIEAYYQETGRAGRDGASSNAWMAYGLNDITQQRQWIVQSDGSDLHKRVQRGKLDALIDLCEGVTCRRQALLSYFGETGSPPCGNCDNCIAPPQTVDATRDAQMVLSAVYRTGESFGVTYVVDVLTGKADERITRNGHDAIKTFGIGRDQKASYWKALIRQLVAAGYLAQDEEGYQTMVLAGDARALLKGEATFNVRKSTAHAGAKGEGARVAKRRDVPAITAEQQPLFDALRATRSALAKASKLPAFRIFADRTLIELVQVMPADKRALEQINGLGTVKVERYGAQLLEVIAQHRAARGSGSGSGSGSDADGDVSAEAARSLAQFRSGLGVEAIAAARGLPPETVYEHMIGAVEQGALETADLFDYDDEDLDEIHAIFERCGTLKGGDASPDLAPVMKALGDRFERAFVRCLLAELR